MKHVDIVSKIVGRENAGKPAGELLPSMGIYALKRELSSLRSLFNDFLEGDDTDDVINRWKDLEAFLNGISEHNTLSSILGNYIPIQGYTDILGEKNFVNGLNIGGIKLYKSDEGVIYIDGNLAVTGGFTMYADDGNVNIPTIAEGLPFDNRTIWFNPTTKQIEVIGGTGGGGSGEGVSNFWDLSGIPSWITNTKPTYSYSEIEGTPDLSKYALVSQIPSLDGYATQSWVKNQGYLTEHQDLSGYQPLITTSNKLPYSLISGTPTIPTSLKNPYALTFGSKTYDGSEAKTITASDLGALTAHQTIYNLTMQAGAFTAVTFDPNGAAKTVNIPTTTSHISEGSNLYFTNARATGAITGGASTIATSNLTASRALISNSSGKVAVSAVTSTELGYLDGVTSAIQTQLNARVTLSGTQTITGEKNFTGGLKVNGSPIVYDATNKYWKLEGDLIVTGGVTMFASDTSFTPSTIMDAITVDGVTLSKEDGVLKVIGGGSGITDITKEMVIGALGYTPYNATNPNGYITSYVDTKNTAGSTNSSSKLFLIGATSQAANPQTYSHDTAYVGTDGCLYSGGSKVLTSHQSIYALTIKNSAGTTQLTYTPNTGAGSITLTKAMVGLGNVENTALSTWTGTSKITTLGTITTGTWNGTKIANSYLANSSITISGTSVSLGGSITQAALRTALGLGSNAYTSTAYLPLAGGTMTGVLTISKSTYPYLVINSTNATGDACVRFDLNNVVKGYVGYGANGAYLQNSVCQKTIRISDAGIPNFSGSTIWHSGNDGSGSGLDADLLDGKQPSELNVGSADYLSYTYSNKSINFARNESKVRLISNTESNSVENGAAAQYTSGLSVITNYVGWQLVAYGNHSTNPYYRSVGDDGVWGSWKQLAYLTDNVASATKLATARTIWGQSFDGTGNVDGNMTGLALMRNIDDVEVLNTGIYGSSVCLGFGTSEKSINTQIDGNNLYFRYGTSHTTGLALLSNGRISAKGNIDIPNNKAIYFKNSSATDINSLYFDNSNILHLGYGTSGSYNTKIYGNNLYLHYGSRTLGLLLNASGNVTIGSSDFAATNYKLYVNGMSYFNSQMNVVGNFYKYNAAKTYRLSFVNDSDYCSIYNIKADGSAYGNLVFQGNVGIGTTSPSAKLHVAGSILTTDRVYTPYIFMGKDTEGIYLNTSGIAWHNSSNSYTSNLATFTASSIFLAQSTTVNGNIRSTGEIKINVSDTPYDRLRFTVNANGAYIQASNNDGSSNSGGTLYIAGIGQATLTSFQVSATTSKFNGNVLATGGITMQSARKLKNIQDERGLSLEELRAIKPTRFTWKDGRDNKIHIGGIADDVMKVLPEVIYKTTDDTLTMDYGNAAFAISASLIKPVINHEERIKILEEENKRLKEEIEILKWNIA